MHDADKTADLVEAQALRQLADLYPAALSPVMDKHKDTLDKLARLEKDGAYGRARVLIRQSHLVEDIAHALARAGMKATTIIRQGAKEIREAVRDESAAAP